MDYLHHVSIQCLRNITYIKKDENRRKTDGFMAFVHALYRADDIVDKDMSKALDALMSIDF